MDVPDLLVVGQPIEREMILQEPAVGLRCNEPCHILQRELEPTVNPRRNLRDGAWLGRLEYQQADNLLRPRGATLPSGPDNNVPVAWGVVRPARTVCAPCQI